MSVRFILKRKNRKKNAVKRLVSFIKIDVTSAYVYRYYGNRDISRIIFGESIINEDKCAK